MDERGASALEYVGGVVLAALVVGGLWTGVRPGLAAVLSGKVCAVVGGCAEKPKRPQPPIECVRAPCGPQKPKPLPTKFRPTPPIECFRAPCPGSRPVVAHTP